MGTVGLTICQAFTGCAGVVPGASYLHMPTCAFCAGACPGASTCALLWLPGQIPRQNDTCVWTPNKVLSNLVVPPKQVAGLGVGCHRGCVSILDSGRSHPSVLHPIFSCVMFAPSTCGICAHSSGGNETHLFYVLALPYVADDL